VTSSAATSDAIDEAFLDRQTAGDDALRRELLQLLDQQCTALLPILSSPHDTSARRDAAHMLRGAAAGLGAGPLAAVLAAVEESARPAIPVVAVIADTRDAIAQLLRNPVT
jgi:HPt (histidine-containing phosphotransfer) domain-containing protein